jgi:hypothetical protein
LVVKIAFVPGGPDDVSVWLDPNLNLSEAGQPTAPAGILADASFDNIHARAGDNTASATFSNIVISATSPFAGAPQGTLQIQGNQLSWTGAGTLQQAAKVTGSWGDSANQSNPQTLATTNAAQFYRLRH